MVARYTFSTTADINNNLLLYPDSTSFGSRTMKILSWGFSLGNAVDDATPCILTFGLFTGTLTGGVNGIPPNLDPADPTVGSFSGVLYTFFANPFTMDFWELYELNPRNGMFVRNYIPGREPLVRSGSPGVCWVDTVGTTNKRYWIEFEV